MKPIIVAEASCNHLGDLQRAIALVEAAAAAGADFIKWQVWSPGAMVLDTNYVIEGGPWHGRSLASLYDEAWTPWKWLPTLFERARKCGIRTSCSVFDIEALAYLESIGCEAYKVASYEIVDLPLIAAIARTGRPIALSTGMASEEEIFRACDVCDDVGSIEDVTLLKCTSAYPALASAANLHTMHHLRSYAKAGVSDHTLGTIVPVVATAFGATMIEKHLTLSRADGGPDAGFSSEPAEFKAMVDAVREAAASIGEVRYGPTEEERPQLQFRRSTWWAMDISVGQTILPEHLTTARPALGIEPRFIDQLIGKPAKRSAKAHTPVTKEFLP
jgi:N-acetylneuraminate synthase